VHADVWLGLRQRNGLRGGGGALEVLALEIDGAIVAPEALAARFGSASLRLGAESVA